MGPGQSRRVLAAQRAEHDALFRAHYPTVVAFLACRIPVEDAVKDLGSEVFVQAWRQHDHVIVDEDRGWLPWLFTVARRMSNAWVAAQATAGARNARIAAPAPEDFTARVVEVDAANQHLSAALAAIDVGRASGWGVACLRSHATLEALVSHRNARLTVHGRLLIVQRHQNGWKQAHIAAAMGVSRKCVKTWIDRYQAEGEAGLQTRSSRPHSMPTRTTPDVEAKVLAARPSTATDRMSSARRSGFRPGPCHGSCVDIRCPTCASVTR